MPIPGFPHTGNYFGAGDAVRAEVQISGTEYGGFPPPLIGINVYLPAGVHLHPNDFPTCPPHTILEEHEPKRCPKGSAAGPPGKATGVVSFGNTRVPEELSIFSFYAPDGGFEFLSFGHEPVLLEIPSTGHLVHSSGADGFRPEFTGTVPLVETVPGAPDASVESIEITIGSAIKRDGKTIYYGRVPRTCPRGGFRAKAEFTFAEGGNPATPITVAVPVRAPGPTR